MLVDLIMSISQYLFSKSDRMIFVLRLVTISKISLKTNPEIILKLI